MLPINVVFPANLIFFLLFALDEWAETRSAEGVERFFSTSYLLIRVPSRLLVLGAHLSKLIHGGNTSR